MLIGDLEYYTRRKNYNSPYSGIDHPGKSILSKKDWHAYHIQDFDYKFNSWGFRGPEYKEYIGKPVNICLGDSFTVNVGGPIEDSWCSQLAENFDIPTLNLGMDGAGNDAIKLLYTRACKMFDVQDTFVMYTFLHRRLQNKKFINYSLNEDDENFQYFLNQRIPAAYEAALPTKCYTYNEFCSLKELGIYICNDPHFYYTDYKDIVDKNRELYICKHSYNALRGNDWPTYKEFIKGAAPPADLLTKEFGRVLTQFIAVNRDGYHMGTIINKIYADYFYRQWKQKNES